MAFHRPYRVGAVIWLARFFFCWGAAFGGVLIIAFLFGDDGDTTAGDRIGGVVVTFLIVCPYLLFICRSARTGAFVDEHEVVIRQFLRTVHYPWHEIAEIDTVTMTQSDLPGLGRYMAELNPLTRNATCLRLRLKNGRQRIIFELNSSVPTWMGSKPDEIAARLNAARPTE